MRPTSRTMAGKLQGYRTEANAVCSGHDSIENGSPPPGAVMILGALSSRYRTAGSSYSWIPRGLFPHAKPLMVFHAVRTAPRPSSGDSAGWPPAWGTFGSYG